MEKIYVIGHRNPDTDSIVAAMAYAQLQKSLGNSEYVAARLGSVSDETHSILEKFGFDEPPQLKNVKTQVKDIEYDHPAVISSAITVSRAWQIISENQQGSSLPVTTPDGKLHSVITASSIARNDMASVYDPVVNNVPLFNVISVLDAHIVNDEEKMDSISGRLNIILPNNGECMNGITKDNVILCGNHPDAIKQAIEIGVNCIIMCQADTTAPYLKEATGTCIISTPFDAYTASRLVLQSVSVSTVCSTDKVVCFHEDDYIDDVKETVLQSRYRSYPVLDKDEKVLGTLSRYHLLRPKRKRVVLVDHNEVMQSVRGLEQAKIMGIIDHHRLGDVQTGNPVTVRLETVGSTNTIIATMYQESGIVPDEGMAGLMLAAILSDTVMFKSPTTTLRDKKIAERLARIANISIDDLGKEIFAASSLTTKTVEELIFTDFKEFHIADHQIGIGQITTLSSQDVLVRLDEILEAMKTYTVKNKYDYMFMMVTDVLKEGTELLFVGDENMVSSAFECKPINSHVFLPHIMSRKKQIVPTLSGLWG